MNAGGTTFWIALAVSLCLAGTSTWAFLSDANASLQPETERPEAMNHEPAEEQSEVTETNGDLESEPVNVEADVTFSFASEVVRFDDDIHLEQDDLFMVTCRSAGGDVMWEYEMDAPLMAGVRADANDDGPREFLLVDSRQGIGLDPEGRPITGFHIKPSEAITSFALVDYEGDGKERYLFGLADGRVLNYRNLGEPTPGWKHNSKGKSVQAIAHLRAGRKDYICTVDEGGTVMLLKRNGQRRVRTPVQLHRVAGSRAVAFEVRADIGSSILIARNADGVAESRNFGDGIAQLASEAEQQLLEVAESRLTHRE